MLAEHGPIPRTTDRCESPVDPLRILNRIREARGWARRGSVSGTGTLDVDERDEDRGERSRAAHVLALVWGAPPTGIARIGEILIPSSDGALQVFGRGEAGDEGGPPRLLLAQSRPGVRPDAPGEPLEDPFLSRRQLELADHADGVRIVNVGKRLVAVDRQIVTRGLVRPGETLEVKGRLLFVCVRRSRSIPQLRHLERAAPFAVPDASGYVGESEAAWDLRDRVGFVARRSGHVLLLGESGTGKEGVAKAIHALSDRASKRFVARNAATFPAGLIDAELFGNVANYPNPGMPERPGLVGEADGGTLFLDEIAELPESLQSHLLRVLDEGGEYQRLGDARRRTTSLRLVAATNRPAEHLKFDLAARLALRLELPSLNDRVADIPLIARHLLRRAASKDPEIGERFFEGWDGRAGEPRLSCALTCALITHRYTTHVRELDRLLWASLTTSPGDVAELTDEVRRSLAPPPTPAPRFEDARGASSSARPVARSVEVTEEQIRASMTRHSGVKERVWRELGLASRFALRRLLVKHGIESEGSDDL